MPELTMGNWNHTCVPPEPPQCLTCAFCVGICKARARLLWSKLSSSAIKAPCTPDSIRLLAYSRRLTDWTHLMTRSLDHTNTSVHTIHPQCHTCTMSHDGRLLVHSILHPSDLFTGNHQHIHIHKNTQWIRFMPTRQRMRVYTNKHNKYLLD